MTDITESDIEVTEEINLCMNPKIKITWTSHGRAESLKQQILQNQKDAQEYERILQKSNNTYIDWAGIARKYEQLTIKLQSQHKKLVDAIQNRIKELTLAKIELSPSNNQHLIWAKQIDELQNLLKESEK